MKTGRRLSAAALVAVAALLAAAGVGCSSGTTAKSSQPPPSPSPAVTSSSNSQSSAAGITTTRQPTAPKAPTQPTPPRASEAPTAPTAPSAPVAPKAETKEFATGVRINMTDGYVEFDATVPLNAKDPEKPRIYLELIACPPDTKEHEAVLLTKAKPSHVHAALLLLGLEPGTPGVWDWEGEKLKAIPPKGPRVKVAALYTRGGKQVEVNPADWVIGAITRKTLTETAGDAHWVFAGSQIYKRQGQDAYRADVDGTLIGLHTFGGETIAWTAMYNPDTGIEEPHWIANAATLPEYNTSVVVRISKE